MHIEEITMEMIFRAFDNTELQTFEECFKYELEKLGVVLLDEDTRMTNDYEKAYFIYVPKAKYADILIGYADTGMIDSTMWVFSREVESFEDDEEVLFHWDTQKNMYEAHKFSVVKSIMDEINLSTQNSSIQMNATEK